MHRFGLSSEKAAVRIFPNGLSKHEALDQLIVAIFSLGVVTNEDAFAHSVPERATEMSTGIACRVAIPDISIDGVTKTTERDGNAHQGNEIKQLHNKPVHVILLFAMPTGSQKEYHALLELL